jgi:hypothetical protein
MVFNEQYNVTSPFSGKNLVDHSEDDYLGK